MFASPVSILIAIVYTGREGRKYPPHAGRQGEAGRLRRLERGVSMVSLTIVTPWDSTGKICREKVTIASPATPTSPGRWGRGRVRTVL